LVNIYIDKTSDKMAMMEADAEVYEVILNKCFPQVIKCREALLASFRSFPQATSVGKHFSQVISVGKKKDRG